MIGDDVTVAAVAVIAVAIDEQLASNPPIWLTGVPIADSTDHRGNSAVSGDHGQPRVEERIHITLNEGLRLHRRKRLRGENCLSVVAHARSSSSELCSELWASRRYHRPTVDEDLRTDLLGDDLAVEFDRTTSRRMYSCFEAQVGGVLG